MSIVHWIQQNTTKNVAYLIQSTDDLNHIETNNLFAISIGYHHILNVNIQKLVSFKCRIGIYFKTIEAFNTFYPTIQSNQTFDLIFTEPNASHK